MGLLAYLLRTQRLYRRLVAATLLVAILAVVGSLVLGRSRARPVVLSQAGAVMASEELRQVTDSIVQDVRPGDALDGPWQWSPDGRWVAFESQRDGWWDIYVVDAQGGQLRNLTNHSASDRFPVWSPDSTRLAFVSWRDRNSEVYVIAVASGELQNISRHPGHDMDPAWSPLGDWLAFVSARDGNNEIYLADVATGALFNRTACLAHDGSPRWSPDGNALVFQSWRTGKRALFMMDVITGLVQELTEPSGSEKHWAG